MKIRHIKTALLLAILYAFSPAVHAQLMLNIHTGDETKQVSVEDIAQIDFDESSVWVLNFKDEAGTAYSINLKHHPIIQFSEDTATVQSDDVDNPSISISAYHLLRSMSLGTIPTGIENPGDDCDVRLSLDGTSLSVSLAKPARVEVFAVDGRSVYSSDCAGGDLQIPLQPGIFIVKIDNQTFKIKK